MEDVMIMNILIILTVLLSVWTIVSIFVISKLYKAWVKSVDLVELQEKQLESQSVYITAISEIIQESRSELERLDKIGAFESDDETGRFFKSMKEVQNILNAFILEDKQEDGEEKEE